ncbi:MAG: glycerophosphodiester phosphodiesterase [Gaiellaceae bacterium]
MTLSLLRGDGRPLRIGHRGAAALAPDNTLESFARALELGVDGIEFDVLGDTVGHDLHATAGLLLDDALAFLAATGTILQLDVKTVGAERGLVDALRRHDLLERSVVSSFHADALQALAAIEPSLPRAFTYPEDRRGIATRPRLEPAVRGGLAVLRRVLPQRIGRLLAGGAAAALTLHYAVVSRAVVDACHARGAAVWAWTVNDPNEAARLAKIGTDAIITDDPRILRDIS